MRRKNFPSALVLNPFSLFCRLGLLSMRTVKQESWPAFLSPWGSEAPACLRQEGVRVSRHESRPFIGLPWVRKGGATRNRRPDCLAAQSLLSCALWGDYGAA